MTTRSGALPRSTPRWSRLAAPAVGLALLTALVLGQRGIRHAEALGLAGLLSRAGQTQVRDDIAYVFLDSSDGMGLRITAQCTVTILLGLLCIGLILLSLPRDAEPWALLRRFTVACCVVVLINFGRLALIAFGHRWFGSTGFVVAHTMVGGALSLGAVVIGLLLMLPPSRLRSGRLDARHQNP